MVDLIRQQTDMRIFDALIGNTDRHAQDQLYSLSDWRLHLIDHSRASRTQEALPEIFAIRPLTMTREMLAALMALTEAQLKSLLKQDLSPRQIRSLLARRDLILEKL